MFTQHCQVVQPVGIIAPRFVTAEVRRPTLHTLSTEDRNRILDELAEKERRQSRLHAESELYTEGRIHRNTRPQRHD